MLEQVSHAIEVNDFQQAIPLTVSIIDEIKTRSISELKKILDSLKDEEILHVVRALDAGLMDRYSQFLIRYRNKHHESPLTRIFYCYELMEKNQYMQVEPILFDLIHEKAGSISQKELKFAYNAMVNVLIDMRRFKEASTYLKKLENLSDEPILDRWGYYYFCLGEWEKAEYYSTKGIEEGKKPQYSYLTLQSIYTAQGKVEEALELIKEGIERIPYYLPLYLEKAKKLKQLGQATTFKEMMNQIDEYSPHHVYQNSFNYSRGVMLYQNGEFEQFQQFSQSHSKVFKGTPYATCTSYSLENINKIPTQTRLQKYNYCVPATVEMLLERYDVQRNQDEIGEQIYHINGSSLKSATEYLESNGMAYQHFFGTIKLYKQLTDENVSVIIAVNYPNSSHVQLLVGYDENLNAFYIQDPGIPEVLTISYSDFEKEYCNNQIHSIAVVPKVEANKLEKLTKTEHQVVEEMLHYLDVLDKPNDEIKKQFYEFVEKNQNYLYVTATAVRMLHLEEEEPLLTSCIQEIQKQHEEVDYFHLVSAYAYVKVRKYDEAKELLEKVKGKRTQFYHYILGRISFEKNEYSDAINHYKEAINMEPDHYDSWSYLALCHHDSEERELAFKYSEASLDINSRDYWNRMNHGYFLFENEQFTKAGQLYTEILRDFKMEAHPWYERARCDRRLEKPRRAIRGLRVAKKLLPTIPYPYVELANILAYTYENTTEAVAGLKIGLKKVKESYSLYMKLGELYEEEGALKKAKKTYQDARKQYPKESSPLLSLVKVMAQLNETEEAITLLKEQGELFAEDCEFLINCGDWLFTNSEQEEDKLLSLTWIEKGLSLADNNMSAAWDLYVRLIEDTPFNERGREFLQPLLEEEYKDNIDLICYIGCLYEKDDKVDAAIEYYNHALSINQDTFPLYRLGEVELNRNNLIEAKHYYKEIIKLDDTFTSAYLRLARIADEEQNLEEELYNLFQILKVSPFDVNLSHFTMLSAELGKLSQVVDHLNSIQGQVEETWRLYALAQCASAEGNLALQQQYLESALEIDSNHFAILESYAALRLQQKQYDESLSIVLHLIARDVEDRDLYAYLIDYIIETKAIKKSCIDIINQIDLEPSEKSVVSMYTAYELEQRLLQLLIEETTWIQSFKRRRDIKHYERNVIQLYEMGYSIDPTNIKSIIWLFEYYNSQGNIDKTIRHATAIINKEWSFDMGYYLAQSLVNKYMDVEHAEKDKAYQRAEEYLQACIEEHPEHAGVHYFLGKLYNEWNELDKAEKELEMAIELDPNDHDFYYESSRLQAKRNNFKEAEELAKVSIQLEPQFLLGYNQVSILLHQQGKTAEALQVIEELLEMDEELEIAHYNKACYLSVLGQQFEEAFQHLAFAIENDTENYFKNLAKNDPDLENLKVNPETLQRMRKLL
jgi:tetratricopeptide (TPR) repeat protein